MSRQSHELHLQPLPVVDPTYFLSPKQEEFVKKIESAITKETSRQVEEKLDMFFTYALQQLSSIPGFYSVWLGVKENKDEGISLVFLLTIVTTQHLLEQELIILDVLADTFTTMTEVLPLYSLNLQLEFLQYLSSLSSQEIKQKVAHAMQKKGLLPIARYKTLSE